MANLMYDAYIKKDKVITDDCKEDEIFIGEDEPISVVDDDDDETSSSDDYGPDKLTGNDSNDTQNIDETDTEVDIETQGIPIELLAKQGKAMFDNINFSLT